MDKNEIHDAILADGSTNIPKNQHLIKNCFTENNLIHVENQFESTAYGASIQAVIITNMYNATLKDITIFSIGIELYKNLMIPIIAKKSTIPGKKIVLFTSVTENQTSIIFKIYKVDERSSEAKNLIYELKFDGIPQNKHLTIEVIFDLDINNTLNISAIEKKSSSNLQKNIIT